MQSSCTRELSTTTNTCLPPGSFITFDKQLRLKDALLLQFFGVGFTHSLSGECAHNANTFTASLAGNDRI